ncbi:MAG TPA: TlpA disulfide reductase family protein [Candidatus Acidoferrales bacterium]|nr:TlpA disulfide reductase family protein [Candidatus Acidoferrales bacterium]
MCRFLRLLFVLAGAIPALHAQCEPSLPVREILEKIWAADTDNIPYKEGEALRIRMYAQALEAHPHDYFLLRMTLITTGEKDNALAWAKSMREKYPEQPVYDLIYAQALVGRDTPAAQRLLEALKTSHPELTRAHLVLADSIFGYGRRKDTGRARREVEEFVSACPAPLDTSPLRSIGANLPREQAMSVAAGVRKRLAGMPDSAMTGVWGALWALEFKAVPPAGHPALRRQIAGDLAHFEKAPERNELRWLTFLHGGYESAGDQVALNRIDEEIVARYPRSEAAKRQLGDRWRRDHKYPAGADKAQMEAYRRAEAAQYEAWRKIWPEDSLICNVLFSALVELPDTRAAQVARIGSELMALYRKNPNWYGSPPLEFRVADAYLKFKVNIDEVPALVKEGADAAEKRQREELADDQIPEEMRAMLAESAGNLKMERSRILLAYYAAVKQTEPAGAIDAELASLRPSKPGAQSTLLERQAQAAEVLGRKLDALVMYRAALDLRPPGATPRDGDKLEENIARLWQELGGTSAAWKLFATKPKPIELSDSRWERPGNPLPMFSLSDIEGKTWKLASLEGKVVLINLWATWCGPCRAEHPEFQKLYEKLKERADVSVISFNVDDDLGKVAPYMKDNQYTFPVLLARELIDQLLPVIAVPQNWFVDTKGKLQWLQLGYAGEPKWQDMILAKLDEVLKGK